MWGTYDAKAIEGFIREKCLCADYVKFNGIELGDDEQREKRMKQDGCFGYNNGIVAFISNGSLYVTPFVDEAFERLEKAGFVDRSVDVPFSVNPRYNFPGSLSEAETMRIWQHNPSDPLLAITNYYDQIMARHSAFRRWSDLCDRAGKFYESGQRVTLDDLVNRTLDYYWKDKEKYNENARYLMEEQERNLENDAKSGGFGR